MKGDVELSGIKGTFKSTKDHVGAVILNITKDDISAVDFAQKI